MNTEHIIQIGVSVDHDAIRNAIIKSATSNLEQIIMDAYVEKNSGYYANKFSPRSALNDIISEKADALIEKHGDDIIEAIITKTSEKLMRNKKVKEYIKSLEVEE